ncbi:MAG: hypothetical protein PVF17_00670 [Ignavibacteria bacterium]|jgi:hypothetical protein
MKNWRNPSVDITEHLYVLIIYETTYEYEGGDEKEIVYDIFSYDTWNGRFIGRSDNIKFKDVIAWYPVPEFPEEYKSINRI